LLGKPRQRIVAQAMEREVLNFAASHFARIGLLESLYSARSSASFKMPFRASRCRGLLTGLAGRVKSQSRRARKKRGLTGSILWLLLLMIIRRVSRHGAIIWLLIAGRVLGKFGAFERWDARRFFDLPALGDRDFMQAAIKQLGQRSIPPQLRFSPFHVQPSGLTARGLALARPRCRSLLGLCGGSGCIERRRQTPRAELCRSRLIVGNRLVEQLRINGCRRRFQRLRIDIE